MKRAISWSLVALSLPIVAISQSLSTPDPQGVAQPSIAAREAACRTALADTANLEPRDFRRLEALLQLGDVLREEAKFSESETLYRQALASARVAFGAD